MNLLGIEPAIVLKYRGHARRHLLATLQAMNLLRGRQVADPAVDDIFFLLDRPHDLPWELSEEQRNYKYQIRCNLDGSARWSLEVNDSWERLGMAVMGASLVRHWTYELGPFIHLRSLLPAAAPLLHFELRPLEPGQAPEVILVLSEGEEGAGLGPWNTLRELLQTHVPYLTLPDGVAADATLRTLRVQLGHRGQLGLGLEFAWPTKAVPPCSLPPELVAMRSKLEAQLEPGKNTLSVHVHIAATEPQRVALAVQLSQAGVFCMMGDAEPQAAWLKLMDLAEIAGAKAELEALRIRFQNAALRLAPTRFGVASDKLVPFFGFAAYDMHADSS